MLASEGVIDTLPSNSLLCNIWIVCPLWVVPYFQCLVGFKNKNEKFTANGLNLLELMGNVLS